ncbi:MAG: tetratricopeptide repeat protein [Elusimicrobiota bacterium]|jgi:tetratricopeptide (TPR) repeat protein|nr:tetratricopeptide repeat protein [Elusimicrobiota bacterium]
MKNRKTALKHAVPAAPVNPHGILDSLEKLVRKNKNIIAGFMIAVIAATAVYAAAMHAQNKKRQQQLAGLFTAELAVAAAQDFSLKPLEDFARQNISNDEGVWAYFTLGNAQYQLKDYANAQQAFKQVMEKGNKETASLAEVSLIAAQIAAKDYNAAIAQAESFAAKYPAHFALAQVKHHKALAQELAGQKAAAKEGYTQITADYPNTYYAVFAQARLTEMK